MRRLLRWLREPEAIGAPDCPILHRWTIIAAGAPTIADTPQGKPLTLIRLPKWLTRDRKLMVHRFHPNVEDRDPHDHPRGFWTFVLWGGYQDLVPCDACGARGWRIVAAPGRGGLVTRHRHVRCPHCAGEGLLVGERMRPGTLRYRPAEHRHITSTGRRSAWTIVLMGPAARPWGFWRDGGWWPWKDYERTFGLAMRCPTDEEAPPGTPLKYTDDGVVPRR